MSQRIMRIFAAISLLIFSPAASTSIHAGIEPLQKENQHVIDRKVTLLQLLDLIPSPESIDYVQNNTHSQLHTLLTEQRHPKTWNLSERMEKDITAGLLMLFSADEDIDNRLKSVTQQKQDVELFVQALENALLSRKTLHIYGSTDTALMANLIAGTFWRPFWKSVKEKKKIWSQVKARLGEDIEKRLLGKTIGRDLASIRGLVEWKDLKLTGHFRAEDLTIKRGDVFICVSASGESRSAIKITMAALNQWKKMGGYTPEQSRKHLFFITNNPHQDLLSLARSRKVIEHPGITKIYLNTGPQAIAGCTWMQAVTIDTFLIAQSLQVALDRALRRLLSKKEMIKLGFEDPITLENKLSEFAVILREVKKNAPEVTPFTKREAETYKAKHFSAYWVQKGLTIVLMNGIERILTFRLSPQNISHHTDRQGWMQIWTPSSNHEKSWQILLGSSLRKPQEGDLGIAAAVAPEDLQLKNKKSHLRRFIRSFQQAKSETALLIITNRPEKGLMKMVRKIPEFDQEGPDILAEIHIDFPNDPFGVNQQTALKIILDAHSVAVMALQGKVIGNSIIPLQLSSPRNIDRATKLIQSHVNDVLTLPQWVKQYGIRKTISYGEANAVLYEAISYLANTEKKGGQTSAVALSIIRILESLSQRQAFSKKDALEIVLKTGLHQYIKNATSQTN